MDVDEEETFDLFTLPSVARDRVIRNMSIFDALSLSFISPDCLRIVSGAIRYQRPLNMRINISEHDTFISLYGEKETVTTIKFEFRKLEGDWSANKELWDVDGIKIFAVKLPSGEFAGFYQAFAPPDQEDVCVNYILAHLLNLFTRCTVQLLYVNFVSLRDEFLVRRAVSSLPICENMHLEGRECRRDHNGILATTAVTKSYRSSSMVFTGKRVVDKLRCTDRIDSMNSSWMTRESLLNLNCTNVILDRSIFIQSDLLAFLKKWQKTTDGSMDRIKRMEIGVPNSVLPLDLKEVGGKPWSTKRRPQWFEDWDCCNGIDIKRADGEWCTVLQRPLNTFRFVVWKNINNP
ncbi:hypothetical protein CAEBREN_02897 [Caenorhabditis brenneri]|uniref:Sdz-33 F-box domain-containing protein n=1 Tax=Caenorhabditis brenneri TaxID=135651 RepID=G0NCB0_CAEBE|nr:hypothetical protein CAEBREN_02897 [Caenorhabditis brenneri]